MSSYPDECSGFPAFHEIYDMDRGNKRELHRNIWTSSPTNSLFREQGAPDGV